MPQNPFANASFLKSAAGHAGFPPDVGLEIAVVGRSNSGKSTAINAIVGRTGIARVSKTPGRTQLINFFELAPERRLVDLPGYGYAKVPASVKARWGKLTADYFETRESLVGLVITVDIRRGLVESDLAMLGWAEALSVPLLLLATKADKLGRGAAASQALKLRAEAPPGSTVTVFSAPRRQGIDEARRQLGRWLGLP